MLECSVHDPSCYPLRELTVETLQYMDGQELGINDNGVCHGDDGLRWSRRVRRGRTVWHRSLEQSVTDATQGAQPLMVSTYLI